MGNSKSKKLVPIKNFSRISLPEGKELVKLVTYNLDIDHSVGSENRVEELIEFLNSSYKSKDVDIITLQGLHDPDIYELILAKIEENSDPKFYTSYSPTDPVQTNNLILSRFPILTSKTYELDALVDIDDIIGARTMVVSVIEIGGKQFNIACTKLTSDIRATKAESRQVRQSELFEIRSILETYIEGTTLLLGCMNILERKNDKPNKEYEEIIEYLGAVDLYRQINPEDSGHTNKSYEREDYTLLLVNKPTFASLKTKPNQIEYFNEIYKKHKLFFLDSVVRSDTDDGFTYKSFPVETVFMI